MEKETKGKRVYIIQETNKTNTRKEEIFTYLMTGLSAVKKSQEHNTACKETYVLIFHFELLKKQAHKQFSVSIFW